MADYLNMSCGLWNQRSTPSTWKYDTNSKCKPRSCSLPYLMISLKSSFNYNVMFVNYFSNLRMKLSA